MKKFILPLLIFSFLSVTLFAQVRANPKNLPLVFKMLQKPSYRAVMAQVQATVKSNAAMHKQSVKEPYLIYTRLWDTVGKTWADTFEKYTITWDINKNPLTISDESWDSVSNGGITKTIESGFVKIPEAMNIDNNVTINYFPGSLVFQELQLGKWVNMERETVTFDNNNRIASAVAQMWSQNAWVNYIKYDITYDTRGDFTSLKAYSYAAGSWILVEGIQETFSFDNNGFINGMVQSVSTSGNYVPDLKESLTLDSKGAVTNALIMTYDTLLQKLTPSDSFYNMSWLYFDPILRIDYQTLGTKGMLGVGGDKYLGYTDMKFDSATNKWGAPEKNIYTYNSDSLPTNIIVQNWQNNAWVNNTSDSTSYYTGGDIKTYLPRYWAGGWYNTSLGNNNINTYDADDDITECIAQNTDPNVATKFDNYSKTEYLYTHNSGIETAYSSDFKIYPNPASSSLNIDLGSNSIHGLLTITDITCRTVQSQTIGNGNIEQVNVTSLQTGIYYLTINTGTSVSTSKFVKN